VPRLFPPVPDPTDPPWEPIPWGTDWELKLDDASPRGPQRAYYSLTDAAVLRTSKKRLHVRPNSRD